MRYNKVTIPCHVLEYHLY